jgi:hypothetical protein
LGNVERAPRHAQQSDVLFCRCVHVTVVCGEPIADVTKTGAAPALQGWKRVEGPREELPQSPGR